MKDETILVWLANIATIGLILLLTGAAALLIRYPWLVGVLGFGGLLALFYGGVYCGFRDYLEGKLK